MPLHPKFGTPDQIWQYKTADGSIWCSIARWNRTDKKEIRPFYTNHSGIEWKRPEGLAPLYNLQRITNIGRVLVVEGEKTADSAQALFPGWAVTTSMGGSSAASKTSWEPLRGKHVTIWPDADDAGMKYAFDVAEECLAAGAKSVSIVDPPSSLPKGWDLSDTPPDGYRLDELLDAAEEYGRSETIITITEPEQNDPPLGYQDELWKARQWLALLHRYSAARELDPNLLLGAILARVSACVPKGTTMDTGIMSEHASTNLLVAAIGATGHGKTAALSASYHIVKPVGELNGYIEGQIGSGEGIAEAYMGTVEKEEYNGDAKKPKKTTEKKQVRHNAFLHLDEGETLHKLAKQRGNTTMPTLRAAASGYTLGALNASAETRRSVTGYHLGLYIGYQPCTVGPLLSEVAEGTPQRFLFTLAGPPLDIPEEPGCPCPVIELQPRHGVVIQFIKSIRAEIRENHRARRAKPPSHDPDWFSHAMLMKCKVAALLCLIDHANSDKYLPMTVDESHWHLAGIICEHSHAIVKWLLIHDRERRSEDRCEQIALRVAGAEASAVAVTQASARAEAMARRLAIRVHERGEMTRREASKSFASKQRHLFDVACNFAEEAGWITVFDASIKPGVRKPS